MRPTLVPIAACAGFAVLLASVGHGCGGEVAQPEIGDAESDARDDQASTNEGGRTTCIGPGDCARGEYCGYSLAGGCDAAGFCVPIVDADCNIGLGYRCACAGGIETLAACTPLAHAPVLPSDAACVPDAGDGGLGD
jgi:hypothetical protein